MQSEKQVVNLIQNEYRNLNDNNLFDECIRKSKNILINNLYDEFVSTEVNCDPDKFIKTINCWYRDSVSEDDLNIFLLDNEVNSFIKNLIVWRRNLEINNLSFDKCISSIIR